MDAVTLQLFCRADAFPGAGQLDQHAVACNAGLLVEFDEVVGLGQAAFGVERQVRVDFGGNAAFDVLEDLAAKIHGQLFQRHFRLGFPVAFRAHSECQRIVCERAVFRVLRRLVKQRRVGGRVLRLEPGDGFDVTGISDDDGVLFQGFEKIHGALL